MGFIRNLTQFDQLFHDLSWLFKESTCEWPQISVRYNTKTIVQSVFVVGMRKLHRNRYYCYDTLLLFCFLVCEDRARGIHYQSVTNFCSATPNFIAAHP